MIRFMIHCIAKNRQNCTEVYTFPRDLYKYKKLIKEYGKLRYNTQNVFKRFIIPFCEVSKPHVCRGTLPLQYPSPKGVD